MTAPALHPQLAHIRWLVATARRLNWEAVRYRREVPTVAAMARDNRREVMRNARWWREQYSRRWS